jgi:hypothetical protein
VQSIIFVLLLNPRSGTIFYGTHQNITQKKLNQIFGIVTDSQQANTINNYSFNQTPKLNKIIIKKTNNFPPMIISC